MFPGFLIPLDTFLKWRNEKGESGNVEGKEIYTETKNLFASRVSFYETAKHKPKKKMMMEVAQVAAANNPTFLSGDWNNQKKEARRRMG